MEPKNGGRIVSGMFWRFGEKITAQFVSFVVSIVLARILMPEDYGIIAIVNVFITIAEIFVTSGLSTSLIQKKDATQIDFSTIFWCSLGLAGILYVVVFVGAPIIAKIYNMSLLCSVIRVFSIKLPVAAFNSIQNAYVSRNMDFRKFFFATLGGTIVSAIVGITLALKGFGVWALVAQYITNSIIDTLVLFVMVDWRPTFEFSVDSAKPLMRYGWKILATDLIGTVFNQLNSFIIGIKYTSADLAFYVQGKKIPDLLNNNIGSTLTAVLFPAMSQTDNIDEIKVIRRSSLKMMGYVLFPIMLGMMAVADNMIIVLLSEKWDFAIPFARIACLDAMVNIMGTTLIQEIKAIGRSDITLRMELIKKPIFLIVILLAMQINVTAIAWTLPFNSILAFCFNVVPVRKYIGFDLKVYLKDAFPSILMSMIMACLVYMIRFVIGNRMICLVFQVVMGTGIYIVLSALTKNDSFYYLINLGKRMLRGEREK